MERNTLISGIDPKIEIKEKDKGLTRTEFKNLKRLSFSDFKQVIQQMTEERTETAIETGFQMGYACAIDKVCTALKETSGFGTQRCEKVINKINELVLADD